MEAERLLVECGLIVWSEGTFGSESPGFEAAREMRDARIFDSLDQSRRGERPTTKPGDKIPTRA